MFRLFFLKAAIVNPLYFKSPASFPELFPGSTGRQYYTAKAY
jgi:hypothetical protein